MKSIHFIFCFLLLQSAYAHKTKVVVEDFGNIKVIFTTGFYFEEMNKGLIIGQYAEMLSKELNFEQQVTLWFDHSYTKKIIKEYNINDRDFDEYSKKNGIFIKMNDRSYEVSDVLQLLEYSILNYNKISNVDGIEILNSLRVKSKNVEDVLSNKIYRPTIIKELENKNSLISYYYKDGHYHLYRNESDGENILFIFDNIFQLTEINENSTIVFSSPDTFYFITNDRLANPSKKVNITNIDSYYYPYQIRDISSDITSITMYSVPNTNNQRVMIFLNREEKLIQNLRDFIR